PLPADFSPGPGACVPADFASYCQSLTPPVAAVPLWWRNACASYDLQEDASTQVPYAVADRIAAEAFAAWSEATCAPGGRVSIAVVDLGPVSCDLVNYNTSGGNQHVIVFRDKVWPYPNDINNTLGLTTVTFDRDTGEIYDADTEINATKPLAVSDPVPSDGYDLRSIMTHEAGHFLGLAHTYDPAATMYAQYTPGSISKRVLESDDVAGICSIYPPGGVRAVAASVAAGGHVAEDACDPTPRHGFLSSCSAPSVSGGCAVGRPGSTRSTRDSGIACGFGLLLAASAAARRRRAR
ncbi:MAG: matrixin family metalloprotease, partial [Polyangiaceae bacterium]